MDEGLRPSELHFLAAVMEACAHLHPLGLMQMWLASPDRRLHKIVVLDVWPDILRTPLMGRRWFKELAAMMDAVELLDNVNRKEPLDASDWDDLVRNSEGDIPDLPPDELLRVWRKSRPMRWLRAALWMVAAIVVFVLFVIAINLAIGKARAHDFWINNSGYKSTVDGVHCCGNNDCEHFTEGDVEHITGGYRIKVTGEVVPDAEAQIGEDAFFWRCHKADGSRRCFFLPAGGV